MKTKQWMGIAGSIAAAAVAAIVLSVPAYASGKNKSGAQLWEANCRHCHNLRPPSQFTSTQWEVLVNHMRVRCGLAGDETRKITEFLKNSH